MKRNAINNKLKFYKAGDRIEIFCEKKYKNYYLRGVAYELIADIEDTTILEDLRDLDDDVDIGIAHYRAIIMALVNDEYQKNEKENTSIHYAPFFPGNTKADYLNYYINNFDRRDLEFKNYIYERFEKKSLTINLEDANILEGSYLNKSIESKKDIVLLSIDIVFDRIESHKYSLFKEKYPKKNYPFLAYFFSKNANPEFGRFKDYQFLYNFIIDLYNTLYYEFDYEYLDEKKYINMLGNIGDLCSEWLNQQEITKRYLHSLNSFKNSRTSDDDPLTRFCNDFFYELIDDLKNQKMIKECEHCGDFFKYKNNKKYCSMKYENKNCQKQAVDRRRYLKLKLKNLTK